MTKRKPKSPLEHEVRDVDLPMASLGRVANRDIEPRLLDALKRLGEIEGSNFASIVVFDVTAVHRRRIRSTFEPTSAQQSSTRRVLARLQRAGLIVGVSRRRRVKIYRLASDMAALSALSLEPLG